MPRDGVGLYAAVISKLIRPPLFELSFGGDLLSASLSRDAGKITIKQMATPVRHSIGSHRHAVIKAASPSKVEPKIVSAQHIAQ
jgi:hypothetical protein